MINIYIVRHQVGHFPGFVIFFSESSTIVMQLPCCPGKQGELSENCLQNLRNNLMAERVHSQFSFGNECVFSWDQNVSEEPQMQPVKNPFPVFLSRLWLMSQRPLRGCEVAQSQSVDSLGSSWNGLLSARASSHIHSFKSLIWSM